MMSVVMKAAARAAAVALCLTALSPATAMSEDTFDPGLLIGKDASTYAKFQMPVFDKLGEVKITTPPDDTPPVMRVRWTAPKSDYIQINPKSAIPGVFVIKFAEGSHVRLGDMGLYINRSGFESTASEAERLKRTGLDVAAAEAQVETINAILADAGKTWGFELTPLFKSVFGDSDVPGQGPNAQFVEKSALEQRTMEELADLDLYFIVSAKTFHDIKAEAALLNKLNGFEVIEQVYPGVYAEGAQAMPTANVSNQQWYLDAAPTGVNARPLWSMPGGQGQGVTAVDVEFDWVTDHEDLPPGLSGRPACAYDYGGSEHGTAVLGVMAAVHNGLGVDGMAPQANYRLESTCRPFDYIGAGIAALFTGERVSGRAHNMVVAKAIALAGSPLRAGDVVLIEQHTYGPDESAPPVDNCNASQFSFVAMEYYPDSFDIIRRLTARGIVVVEAAGNGTQNMDTAVFRGRFNPALRHSGAILVGASAPNINTPASGAFNAIPGNYGAACFTNTSARVDVHAWGGGVATTGYGTDLMFNPPRTARDPFNGRSIGGTIPRYYSASFGGTSSAAAIIAGAAVQLQGLKRAQTGGLSLSPVGMREALRASGTAPAGGAAIGVQPNLTAGAALISGRVGGFEGPGVYVIRSLANGKVLDVDVSWFRGQDDGQRLVQWSQHDGLNQRFRISAAGTDGAGRPLFTLQPLHSRKVLDVEGASGADLARIIQFRFTGGANQLFRIEASPDPRFNVIATFNGMLLSTTGRDDGFDIVQHPAGAGLSQMFVLTRVE
ncbi:RICIN domain-containing protein [Asticcacaulis sp. AC402]|uniref:RICIN domain-containing protein n=1 Tax=Asticcacaulis sp. AC402 TaxID=1282361 RepID=UPI0003C3E3F3|nr:RICIN domain-containing protein [Asticcacaulis sp. AC402]ESQ73913.1 hypothetical protein ABAC402_16830 [Asticcacaulis sp. AC402]